MGILEGKRILVTGVITAASIAFHVARGGAGPRATVVMTGFGWLSLRGTHGQAVPSRRGARTRRDQRGSAGLRWPDPGLPSIRWLDRGPARDRVRNPEEALGETSVTRWPDVATASGEVSHVRRWKAVTMAACRYEAGGGSVVGLDFDARRGLAGSDWMAWPRPVGVLSEGYLAGLGKKGVRVNWWRPGRSRTMAQRPSPASTGSEDVWGSGRRFGWSITETERPRGACVH